MLAVDAVLKMNKITILKKNVFQAEERKVGQDLSSKKEERKDIENRIAELRNQWVIVKHCSENSSNVLVPL